ncbi:MAG: threonine-phosphate decarboxylase CobD [Pseudomonadota bacterium]
MRDHGGNLGAAIQRFGGAAEEWIDLSTGINRQPYPLPALPPEAWTALPTAEAEADLIAAASEAYRTPAAILPLAGAQAAIQLLPRLQAPGEMRVLGPTYNEHAASFAAQGWRVSEVARFAELGGADAAVLVSPNNPTGPLAPDPGELIGDILELAATTHLTIIDESFVDATPEASVAPHLGAPGLIVLRSFGKFYGLAGVRLGFALGAEADIAALRAAAGPWAVSGPALAIGAAALKDRAWAEATTTRLGAETARLDALVRTAGWRPLGGTHLFRLYDTGDAASAQARLAGQKIWSRIFPYSESWLRLGLPGSASEWARLETALSASA